MWSARGYRLMAVFMVGLLLQGATARISETIDLATPTRDLQGYTDPTGSILQTKYPGDYSYWQFKLSSVKGFATSPVPTGWQPGFCLDESHYMVVGASYPCVVYCSSLDPNFASCVAKVAGKTYTPPAYNIDMSLVNWVINNYFDGMRDGESPSCFDGISFTSQDIQEAIWLLTNPNWAGPGTCRAQYIAGQAKQYGVGFVPDKCHQLAAVAAVVYDCSTSGSAPSDGLKQLVFFYARLDILGAPNPACVPWPVCTQPQLPDECIGYTDAQIQDLYSWMQPDTITANSVVVPPSTPRRNLTCGECKQVSFAGLPAGCECPNWPCCGPNIDPPGYACKMCPAVALVSAYTKALSGPGGCASAIAWMTGSSVPDADYMNYKEDIKRILLNTTYNPAAGTSFPQKVTAIASATGTATAKAAIRYYQTGCVCKGYAGYAFTAVQSKIYAVALAVAHAYSSAIAEVAEISRDGSALVSYAFSQSEAIAASVNTALLEHFNSTHYLPGQCTNTVATVQTAMATNVTNAVACTMAEALATAYFLANTADPTTPLPIGLADGCACSVSVAVGGSLNTQKRCPISCPSDPSSPDTAVCTCPKGYAITTLGCATTAVIPSTGK